MDTALVNELGREVFSRPVLLPSFCSRRDIDDLILLRLKHIGEYVHRLDIRFTEVVQIFLRGLKLRVSEALLYLPDVDAAVQQERG